MATKKRAKLARKTARPPKRSGVKPGRSAKPGRSVTPARSAKPVRRAETARKAAPRAARPARRAPAKFPTPPANAIGCRHLQVDYTTHSIEDVRRFYTDVLGFREFHYDPIFQHLSVQTASGSSLGFMPPMPGPPEQWRPPREPAIYLLVEDVDRAHRDLLAKGVTFQQEPTDMPWGHRVAMLRDPEGRTVFLARPIQR